ncbi:MAG: alpha/beta hydrolase-fold protein [Myxococcota bacterium]|nr:alpha/beta hydrolase-fold protein [Myxococcota bacterium]
MEFVSPHLRREIFGWHSPALGMDMPIVRYGHWGHALLLFPTASGDFLEAERMFLIKSIEPYLMEGKLQVFAIESINKHAWMNNKLPVPIQAHNHAQYSRYLEEEVVPHIRRVLQNEGARIGVSGASFGAFFAANAFFRRPDLFDTLVAMSGFYDLQPGYTEGYWDNNLYFNNPMSFVPNLSDWNLDLVKNHSQIHIMSGQGEWEKPEASRRFSQMLWDKGIWHHLDLWGHDIPHDWTSWRQMLPYYVGNKLGW